MPFVSAKCQPDKKNDTRREVGDANGIERDAGALTRRVERVDLSRWERRGSGILRSTQNDTKKETHKKYMELDRICVWSCARSRTLTASSLSDEAAFAEKAEPLTRAEKRGLPATRRARRVIGGAERDILTGAR